MTRNGQIHRRVQAARQVPTGARFGIPASDARILLARRRPARAFNILAPLEERATADVRHVAPRFPDDGPGTAVEAAVTPIIPFHIKNETLSTRRRQCRSGEAKSTKYRF
jgi:hypothetical protein